MICNKKNPIHAKANTLQTSRVAQEQARSFTCSSASACLGLRSPTLPLMSPVGGCWINTASLRGPFKKTHHQKGKRARSVPDRMDPVSRTSPRCSLTASGFRYLLCQVPPPRKHVQTRQTRGSAEIPSNQHLLQKILKTTGGSLGARKRKCRLKPRPFSLNLQRSHWPRRFREAPRDQNRAHQTS